MITIGRQGQEEPTTTPLIHLFRRAKHTCWFPAGATIFRQGEPGDLMYVITAGQVAIVIDGICVATCGAGEIVGEMAFLDGQPRSAAAVARTECTLAPIDQRSFQYMVANTPHFAIQVMQTLTTRLRRLHSPNHASDDHGPAAL